MLTLPLKMSGFSRNRFVDLCNTDDEELTCGICLDIFNNPQVVQCCRQTYCHDCITKWINENQSCPNDRKSLTENNLVEPPRLVQNMIAKLKIHCDHQDLGCEAIIKLEFLIQHSLNCEYNPKNKKVQICENCGFVVDDGEEHNCISNLKILNNSLQDEISRMRESIEHNAVISARNWIESKNEPIISFNIGFSKILLQKVINISQQVIQEEETFEEISEKISEKIKNCQKGKKWNVIVYAQKCGESLVYSEFHYIDMSFGEIRIEIFSAGSNQ